MVCEDLRWLVIVCDGAEWSVVVCVGVCWRVLACAGMWSDHVVCDGTWWHAVLVRDDVVCGLQWRVVSDGESVLVAVCGSGVFCVAVSDRLKWKC